MFGRLARTRLLVMIMLVGTFFLASMQPIHASVTQEQQFLSLVNHERTSRGLAALTPQPVVTDTLSRPWSLKMAVTGRLEHSGSGDQILDAVAVLFPTITGVGENVGYGATVDVLHRALMDSPVHRANLLSEKFQHVGLGVAQIGSTLWVTQTFFTLAATPAAPAPAAAAAPAPADTRPAVLAPVKAVAAPVKPPVAAPAKAPTKAPAKPVAVAVAPAPAATVSQVSVPAELSPPVPSAAVQALTGPLGASPSPTTTRPPLDVADAQLVRRPATTTPTVAAGLLLALGLALHLRLSLGPARLARRFPPR